MDVAMSGSSSRIWVIIPCYNESSAITATLDALAVQTRAPEQIVVVDNGSTDDSTDVVERYARSHPAVPLSVIREPEKGTGRAADTGMRHAIAKGAMFLARTDADCRPRSAWIDELAAAFARGDEFVVGKIVARTDDCVPRAWERLVLPAIVGLAGLFGRLRPSNRGPGYLCRYRMCAGNNLALTSSLYLRCGGFPRTSIEESHEDRALMNRARRVTSRIAYRRSAVVENSVRRLRAYGLRNTLLWYWDHRYAPTEVDVR